MDHGGVTLVRRLRVAAMAAVLTMLLPVPFVPLVAADPATPTETVLIAPSWGYRTDDVPLLITVTPQPDGGTLELFVDGASEASQPIADPSTYIYWTPPSNGTFSLQVAFSGTAAFDASTSEIASIYIMSPQAGPITLTVNPDPAIVHHDVTLTATIDPPPGPGDVDWYVNNIKQATTAVQPDGSATWTTSFSTEGVRQIHARFPGNDDYGPSQSAIYPLWVRKILVNMTVTVPPGPLPPGHVTATVVLDPNPGGGALRLRGCGGCGTQDVPVDPSGTTLVDLGWLDVGYYAFSVDYIPIGDYNGATGEAPFSVWHTSSTVVTALPQPAYQGELPVSLTATVSTDGSLYEGTVLFHDTVDGVTVDLGPVPVNPSTGQASYASNALRAGEHSVVASFSGLPWVLGSDSEPTLFTVAADNAVHGTFKPSLAKFHPYKDGYKDKVSLAGVLSERATVTIRIYNSSGTLVRKFALGWRNAGKFAIAWNGRKSNGAAVPAGTYTVKASFKDVGGHSRSIKAKVTLNWKRVIWKSVTVTKYGEVGEYYVGIDGGAIYYSPDYPRGRILDSGPMIRDCESCGFAAGRFVFTVKGSVLAYRKLYLAGRGHGFIDRDHPGHLALVDPVTLDLVLIRTPYPYDEKDVSWGIPFTTAQISATRRVEAWIWMDQAWGDAYDLNWFKLTYQYAVWA